MGATLRFAAVLALVAICNAEPQNYHTTPIPILKHINRHNEDGSYSYGYENADGSYKIETKHATGEVFGKYGYVDDTGKVREVEYGASRRGFEPAGTDINVAPPTLHSSYTGPNDYDDGQYREDPSVYYKDDRYNSRPASSSFSNHRFQQQPQRYNPPPPPPQPQYNPPQQSYHQPRQYNPPAPSRYVAPGDYNIFRGHPASNFDVHSGSYSVNYSG
ncbi:hypothetical protein R5R35_004802 [Gryllus longicercus]|uniref:Cuticular protein n=1 Tax=Gryllus longicercus TaxID=2509291 RepID=A0AAN9W4G6_9ORTH